MLIEVPVLVILLMEESRTGSTNNGVSMFYGDPNKTIAVTYLSFSHIPIKWQPLTMLPCSFFVSYFSTTLTVVSAEFFQC
jgi:hypothetical protein